MSLDPPLRRTRFVCISDTHNTLPKLPRGDVLIHAGDLTNQGSLSELQKSITWLEKAPFECKLVIAGNHDITLDSTFYKEYGPHFHNQQLQDTERCISLLRKSSLTHVGSQMSVIFRPLRLRMLMFNCSNTRLPIVWSGCQ